MAARVYTVSMTGATIIGANTLVFINPGASVSLKVLRAWVSQYGTSTGQQLGIRLVTQPTGFPTLVAATPALTDISDGVSKITGATTGAAGTCGVNASAEGSGTKVTVVADAFNSVNGWLWVPTPDEQVTLSASASSGFGIYMPSTPTTLTLWNAGITFIEV